MKKQHFLLLMIFGLFVVGCVDPDEEPILQEDPVDLGMVEVTLEAAYSMVNDRAFMSRSYVLTT